MTTTRYSGELTIRMTYYENHLNGYYSCRIYAPDLPTHYHTIVGAPAHLTQAVDSPEAFDETARAALAFGDDEKALPGDPDFTCLGYAIHRTERD